MLLIYRGETKDVKELSDKIEHETPRIVTAIYHLKHNIYTNIINYIIMLYDIDTIMMMMEKRLYVPNSST